ncbi:hypothetical protein DL766_000946 [Monosporascus sp. MC13-8B]|uniref:C2H2-type domain-containing protein n=1 Tax=Monosporascus cannonballus TaxID=155416 RepID=A0ABY0GYJ8_9PEZI|nr:hypothetical protein DL762_007934 [Monosporascus cannonballus]RYP00725.1 hypothetical protein DL763_000605 [Monosporascus cannonballus]RYP38529.1 hypothetical protein DL766_000946 [Monosporascus sp. MC13-8B]
MSQIQSCPFCGFQAEREYAMLLHMETLHSEDRSPFIVDGEDSGIRAAGVNTASNDEENLVCECPVDGCGEFITLAELDDHVGFHAAEEQPSSEDSDANPVGYPTPRSTSDESAPPRCQERRSETVPAHQRHAETVARWKQILHMSSPLPSSSPKNKKRNSSMTGPRSNEEDMRRRLGKAELGRYAHEDRMPDRLVSLLRNGRYVSSEGIIPVIEQLLRQSPTTCYAYLCHPCVQHISKLRREGGFCGYRNIQMLASYIVGTDAPGAAQFRRKIPSIFRIQDYIENAWDMGINAHGSCEVQAFKNPEPRAAETSLLQTIERYFQSSEHDSRAKVRGTSLPPVYFQHRGHSLTIIGIEKRLDGAMELLVFDPVFRDPDSITRYVGRKVKHKNPDLALKLYRRGDKYLKKYPEFEVLRLG